MNNYNGFDLLIAVVFGMSPQLGGLGPISQDLVISFCISQGENIPQFHNSTSELFRSEVKFSCCTTKEEKSTDPEVNTSHNCKN